MTAPDSSTSRSTSVEESLPDSSLTVVSNREPYVHEYADGDVRIERPTGGLVAALDEVVADVGGTWVAWGSGDADFDPAVAPGGEVRMPPGSDGEASVEDDDPSGYTLSRVDLPRRLVDAYYYGYSNQVLWPLCHLDTNYVRVDPAFFAAYEEANERFVERVVDTDPDVVWFQDYHLALAPALVRARRPDARLVHFWHVPWPTPEVFEICPQADALLSGMLANDAVGFHVPRYATNFLDCAAEFVLGATVDHENGTIAIDGHTVDVYASPIGVAPERVAAAADSEMASHYWERVVDRYDIDTANPVLLGVDRLDYTKGIVERLDAIDHLLNTRPELAGQFTFVQKATRTRERIPAYRQYHDAVRARIAELDHDHGTGDWAPVVYVEENVDHRALAGLYRNADIAVVSSRRDGMNLVAKEFVAASVGSDSALVLSRFAGAADALCPAALSVNPYDVAGFADTLERVLSLDTDDKRRRMESLARTVTREDIDHWLDDQLSVLAG